MLLVLSIVPDAAQFVFRCCLVSAATAVIGARAKHTQQATAREKVAAPPLAETGVAWRATPGFDCMPTWG